MKSSDVQNLLQRIEQLEGALSQAQQTQAPSCLNVLSPEGPRVSVPSEVNSSQVSDGLRERESTLLAERSPSPSVLVQTPIACGSYPTGDRPQGVTVSASQLGPNWFFNGIPISSEAGYQWISARTGQNITATEFGIPIKSSSPFSMFQPYFAQEICDLPDKSFVREILNRFFASSSFTLSFPILDQVLFEETVETAYKPMERNLLPASHISAKACVLSALSLTSRFCPARKNPFSMDADIFAAKAHYLLMQITGYTSLDTLQALLMLVSTAICHSLQIYRLIWLFSNYDVYSVPTGKALPSFIRLRVAQSAPWGVTYSSRQSLLRPGFPIQNARIGTFERYSGHVTF